jgi:hypothetical protein
MTLHPEGTFKAKIVDHGMDSTKKGQPVAWVKFDTEGGGIMGFFHLSDKAAEYSLKKIAACGFLRSLAEFNDGSCIGNEVEITVDHETYENKLRAKVGWVNVIGAPTTMNKDKVAALNAKRYDALLAKIGKDMGAKATKPKREPGEEGPLAGEIEDEPPTGCEGLPF